MYKTQVIIQAGGLASEANKCPGEAPPAHVCQCSVWAEGPCGGLDVSAAYLRQASKLLGAKPPPPSIHVCQSSVMRAKRANGWGEAPPHTFVKAPSGPKALTEV